MNDKTLRESLLAALTEKNAHAMFEDIAPDFPVEHRGAKLSGIPYTAWQLLEHLRICQWDILEFSRRADHVSPDWPEGYWPKESAPPEDLAWDKSVGRFRADLDAMQDMLSDESNDLLARFTHGDGQTLLREALVLAKHNSYHLGQLAMIKRLVSHDGQSVVNPAGH